MYSPFKWLFEVWEETKNSRNPKLNCFKNCYIRSVWFDGLPVYPGLELKNGYSKYIMMITYICVILWNPQICFLIFTLWNGDFRLIAVHTLPSFSGVLHFENIPERGWNKTKMTPEQRWSIGTKILSALFSLNHLWKPYYSFLNKGFWQTIFWLIDIFVWSLEMWQYKSYSMSSH